MARVGYYILSEAQAAVLTVFGISYETVGGLPCVTDLQSVIDQIDEIVWEDGELTDEEGGYLDTMYAGATYMYWSTEAHSWFPA